ncbi:hypothetical protein SAMN05216257_10267 [Meinhardsimonia xiamenensis]|uniref:Uncharacterized protein n=2 Tax=Meinhardsimonia xiamenensis TaxID=990712 RepID=A0A1G9ABU4_9RHOB|nr:hypothetical protein [Meinhardsimonia xiamenensis]PRX35454.1 hypothetical protein LV81_02052 [Meinhardsimonia xiamenensis]SDK24713.1 hypothetical protein SAMN05216257_10267 [Meinhardsimonia xiamenensis]
MLRRVSGCLVLALATAATGVFAEDIEGLYRPPGSNWSCDIVDLGMDGGALGFIDNTFYGVENACDVISAVPDGDWTALRLACAGEGETYYDAFRVRKIDGGLEFDREGNRFVWESCARGSTVLAEGGSETRNRGWTASFGQGWLEFATRDDLGNEIILACNTGGFPLEHAGSIFVRIAGRPVPPGPIVFSVDGQRMTYEADREGGVTIMDCRVCLDNFNHLLEKIAAGQKLTIIPSGGGSVSFSLRGSRRAIGRYPACPGPG